MSATKTRAWPAGAWPLLLLLLLVCLARPAAAEGEEAEAGADDASGTNSAAGRMINLQKSFVQIFSVVIIAYLIGTSRVVDPGPASRTVGWVYSNVLLPFAMFYAMASTRFGSLNWPLIGGIFVGKFVAAGLSALGAFVFTKDRADRYLRAGNFIQFGCTISLPVGLTVMPALFPALWKYILITDVLESVSFFPTSLVLLEASKAERQRAAAAASGAEQAGPWMMFKHIAMGVLCSPIVLMSIAGAVCAFIFHGELHPFVTGSLDLITRALQFNALFSLGLTLVGKLGSIVGKSLAWSVPLALASNIIRAVAMFLGAQMMGVDQVGQDFAFIFGALPTSLLPFALSLQYGETELIASATVVAYLTAMPLVYFAMTLLQTPRLEDLLRALDYQSDVLLALSVGGCALLIGLFFLIRERRRFPNNLLFALACTEIVYSFARLSCNYVEHTSAFGALLVYTANFCGFMAQAWVVIMGFNLYYLITRGREAAERLSLAYLVLPFVVAIPTLLLRPINVHTSGISRAYGCAYVYDTREMVVAAVFWTVALLALVVLVVLVERVVRRTGVHPPPLLTDISLPVTNPNAAYSVLCDDILYVQRAGKWRVSDRFRVEVVLVSHSLGMLLCIVYAIAGNMVDTTDMSAAPSGILTVMLLFAAFFLEMQGLVLFCAFGMRPDALDLYKKGLRKLRKSSIAARLGIMGGAFAHLPHLTPFANRDALSPATTTSTGGAGGAWSGWRAFSRSMSAASAFSHDERAAGADEHEEDAHDDAAHADWVPMIASDAVLAGSTDFDMPAHDASGGASPAENNGTAV